LFASILVRSAFFHSATSPEGVVESSGIFGFYPPRLPAARSVLGVVACSAIIVAGSDDGS
jgi:hypothetical protein